MLAWQIHRGGGGRVTWSQGVHGQGVLVQQVQLASLVAAVLIHLQQLPPQLLLNLHLQPGRLTANQ